MAIHEPHKIRTTWPRRCLFGPAIDLLSPPTRRPSTAVCKTCFFMNALFRESQGLVHQPLSPGGLGLLCSGRVLRRNGGASRLRPYLVPECGERRADEVGRPRGECLDAACAAGRLTLHAVTSRFILRRVTRHVSRLGAGRPQLTDATFRNDRVARGDLRWTNTTALAFSAAHMPLFRPCVFCDACWCRWC